MANYGIGIGAFAQGLMQGVQLGKQFRDAKKQWDAEAATKDAMDAAKAERADAVAAEQARLLGIGPQGPQAPAAPATPDSAATPPAAATTQPVDMSTPAATPLPAQQPGAAPAAAPAPAAPAAAPTPTPAPAQIPPDALKGAPMADSGGMAPAPTPAEAVGAARAMDTPAQRGTSAATSTTGSIAASPAVAAATRGINGGEPMTDAQARALAEKSAPSVMDFFRKKGVPKIAETYLAQGDPAKAQAWTDWAEAQDNKRNMATWAKAWRATQMGDIEGAADHFMELYKNYNDGVTPVSKEVVKDKDGNITGFNVKLKTDATGEERTSFIDRNQMLEMGLAALSPPQMFEMAWKRQQTQDAAKAKVAEKIGEAKLKLATDTALENQRQKGRVQLEGVKHEGDLERDVQKSKLDAETRRNKVQEELDAKVEALKNGGYSDEFISSALPSILGIDQYKRSTSPDEAKRLAFGDRMKNDPSFARLPVEKQRALIEQDMAIIYGGMKPTEAPAGAPAAASGAPPASPAARGLPVLDTKTGKIVYR
ncbi:virion structural protein [Burkholderia phage BcepMigl]|uniref:Virion associated protein n=1 Tax=Burkholderia phage BcepMigl TaxID=2886899 RepID=I6X6V0_9CAUD|nr:virion structural protein [Burkholderia phage BcepMigl]AFN39137.1 virion associated protein [Burkholderia phage BcepMigl]